LLQDHTGLFSNLYPACKKVKLGLMIFLYITNIIPVSLQGNSTEIHIPIQHQGKEIPTEVKLFIFLIKLKDFWFQDVYTGIDGITENLAPVRFFQKADYPAIIISHHYTVVQGNILLCQNKGSIGTFLLMKSYSISKIKISNGITADHYKSLIKEFSSIVYTTRSAQCLLLYKIVEIDTPPFPIAKITF